MAFSEVFWIPSWFDLPAMYSGIKSSHRREFVQYIYTKISLLFLGALT